VSDTTADPIDGDYFVAEVMRLREMWGQLDFWRKPMSHRSLAIKGLMHVYATASNLRPNHVILMQSTLIEYERRSVLMLRHPSL
jgi:tRNA (Thr-GGU) A37 N-methylase